MTKALRTALFAMLMPITALAQQPAAIPEPATLTLLTFNVMADDLDLRVDDLAAYIAQLQPDIACIQEMHLAVNYERMRQRLADHGWPMEGRHIIDYMAVFSRHPIRDYMAAWDGHERRIQTFAVDYPVPDSLRVYQVHPVPGHGCTVVDRLLELITQHHQPRFLLGDFNLTPNASCFPLLLAEHIRACTTEQSPSCDNTVNRPVWCHYHPSYCEPGQFFPDAAIDHILFEADTPWQLLEAWCDHEMTLSDHFPVIARFVHLPPATLMETE